MRITSTPFTPNKDSLVQKDAHFSGVVRSLQGCDYDYKFLRNGHVFSVFPGLKTIHVLNKIKVITKIEIKTNIMCYFLLNAFYFKVVQDLYIYVPVRNCAWSYYKQFINNK